MAAAMPLPDFALRLMERADTIAARSSLSAFAARTYPGYRTADHIRILCDALERIAVTPNSRLIVTMPPRHSKSVHVSELFPAWYLGRFPDRRIIAASHTASLAYTFSRRVRNRMKDPLWPFPGVSVADDKGAISAWDTTVGGGYMAVGVGGSPTGHGADILDLDDPIRSAADADSEISRDALWEWYQGTIRTRLQPGGSIILTATRWHEDDLTGRLLEAAKHGGEVWEHIHMPAVSDAGHPLWPEYWSLDALHKIRQAVGSRVWEAQYQGRPSPAEGGMFKRHWWRFWQPQGANLPAVPVKMPDGSTRQVWADEQPGWWDTSAQSWDMTFKETKSGSFVVGLVGATRGPNSYLLDCYRDRVEFTGMVQAVRNMTAKHPTVGAKLIEDKANGPAVIDTLRGSISGVIAVGVDGSKEARAASSTPRVESGNWYLPHPDIAPWVHDFIAELSAFPTGANDDQVDAFSQLDRYLAAAPPSVAATGMQQRSRWS